MRRTSRRRFLPAVEWLRSWSYAHPRLRVRLREAWGVSRQLAHRLHVRAPFEPEEFDDLRRLARTAPGLPAGGDTVLILSFRGWSTHVVIESTIGHAVMQRGARPVFAYCGGRLPICDVVPAPFAPPMPCHSCSGYAQDALTSAGFHPIRVTDLIDLPVLTSRARAQLRGISTVAECAAFEFRGLALGEFVRTSVAGFVSRGSLADDDPLTLRSYRDFLVSGMVLVDAFDRLLTKVQPNHVLVLNGAFFAERILAELADRRGARVVRYEKGFMTDSVLVSRWYSDRDDLDYGEAAWREAVERPFGESERAEVDEYLRERRGPGRAFDVFSTTADEQRDARAMLHLAPGRLAVGVFTNILWDSGTQDKDRVYPSMAEWMVRVVSWAVAHPDIDVVVRIHPAEVRMLNHPSREPMLEHIQRNFAVLPPNLVVVPPESPLSSYALFRFVDVGLVYTSTVGLELACTGTPTVTAANAHYSGKGFTYDPDTPEEYWATVDDLLANPPDAEQRERSSELARRYAHLFFFRFHQHLTSIHEPGRSRVRVTVNSAAELAPGRDQALDRIVSAVLGRKGTPEGDGAVITPAGLQPGN